MRQENPLVSIVCDTYNHAPYIRRALDSFLSQETDFPFEIIVHDDASTDGTADIIRAYEAERPDLFRCVYRTENVYSKDPKILEHYVFPLARGQYIAICEGDDYWTSPHKLQTQVLLPAGASRMHALRLRGGIGRPAGASRWLGQAVSRG